MFTVQSPQQQQQEKEEYRRSNRRNGHPRRKTQSIKLDTEYPDQRLDVILKGLEERVQAGKTTLYKLQTHRNDLEFQLNGLQSEKLILDQSLAEAKEGEAFVREKEREINEEFKELSDDRRKPDPGPLIKRTLILGRELFGLLLRDAKIEDTSRKAFQAQVVRIEREMMKKAEERNLLQERVLQLQKDCEADLEKKRLVYDEIQMLRRRSEALDATIEFLSNMGKDAQYQIAKIRAAIKERQSQTSDSIVTTPRAKKIEEKQLSPGDIFAQNVYKAIVEAASPKPSSTGEDLNQDVLIDTKKYPQLCFTCGGDKCDPIFGHQTTCLLPPSNASQDAPHRSPSYLDVTTLSADCIAFASGYTTAATSPSQSDADEIHVEAEFDELQKSIQFNLDNAEIDDTQSGDETLSVEASNESKPPSVETSDDSKSPSSPGLEVNVEDEASVDTSPISSDDSYLTIRTSRSILHELSSPSTIESDSDDDDDDDESSAESTTSSEKYGTILNELQSSPSPPRDTFKAPLSTSCTSPPKKLYEFEVWRQVLPGEISDDDPRKKASKQKPPSKE